MYQKHDFYRHARYVHAWLSAFAFVVLIFFAATGLLLNNPQWLSSNQPPSQAEHVQLVPVTTAQVHAIHKSQNPSQTVLELAQAQHVLIGHLQSSEVIDNEVMLHMESPAGRTDIWYDPAQQHIEITQQAASAVVLLKELHRGKHVNNAWSWLIDISATVILLLSLAGFILFLSLKARLITHVWLIVLSIVVLMAFMYSAV